MLKHGFMDGRDKINLGQLLRPMKKERFYAAGLLLILALSFYLSTAFFYGPSWINGSDNYIYTGEALSLSHGNFGALHGIDDNVKYLIVGGIAFFYLLLGYSLFTAAMFGIICILLTIVVLYLIGKELHSSMAGLFAGFMYAIIPLVQIEGSAVGDDVPLAFFLCLSILLAIMALKMPAGKERNRYLLLSGFVSAINYLSVGEALIGTLFIFLLLIANFATDRKKRSPKGIGFFLLGIAIAALVIMLIGLGVAGNPFYVEQGYQSVLGGYNNSIPFSSYVSYIFSNSLQNFFNGSFFSSANSAPYTSLSFGYFGVALIVAVLYLLIMKRKAALIPAAWFTVVFLYLSFGSQSMFSYVPILNMVRYAIAAAPAIALLVGMAFADMISSTKHSAVHYRIAAYVLIAALVCILFTSSLAAIRAGDYSEYYGVLPLEQIGSFVDQLPANTLVFGPQDIPWVTYINQSRPGTNPYGYQYTETTCNSILAVFNNIKPGSYLVGNVTNATSCGLIEVFSPSKQKWLNNYTVFGHWGVNFYLTNVYKYLPPVNSLENRTQ
jgi:hypothetical protein